MRKTRYIPILILILSICSCISKKNISELKQESEFEKSFSYISKDTVFSKKLKSYFPDLKSCLKLNFSSSNNVKPITLNEFPIGMLNKTKLLSKIEGYSTLDQTEQIKTYESLYLFPAYQNNEKEIQVNNPDCEIRLTFAKKVNNFLPIKYTIVDKNVDSKINYKPRIGLYILEFNEDNIIIDSGYLLMSE
ncbi:hypothetical protein G3567_13110 [Psychroflexus sp. YR1-1]|uniref:Lipoprotein n=1 Tax=Psychroflexus aurantiacus TaxID=2709310 RepID=A0A6B3R7L4_9FLAO|nr:hypothetical protein [Psychroflexus aurantiacus]